MGGCSQDEPAGGAAQDLPDGMYPLQIAGVSVTAESSAEPWGADSPQSRVTESADGKSSLWEGGEEITVQLSGTKADGTSYTTKGQYTPDSDKQALPS